METTTLTLLLLLSFIGISYGSDEIDTQAKEWNYELGTQYGPSNWSYNFPLCESIRQSPIDIQFSSSIYSHMPDFVFNENYHDPSPGEFAILNNGHTLSVTLKDGTDYKRLQEGHLKSTFRLLQFHMHWGIDDESGSEHAINGKFYPMEIHFVHMNMERFQNLHEAISKPRGLAVLGVMVKIGQANEALQKIIDHFHQVKNASQEVSFDTNFSPKELMPPYTSHFYRYQGSLTTPPCAEEVIWSVFKESIQMSSAQLAEFRKLSFYTKKPMMGNHRPLQPLNERFIVRSFLSGAPALTPSIFISALIAMSIYNSIVQ